MSRSFTYNLKTNLLLLDDGWTSVRKKQDSALFENDAIGASPRLKREGKYMIFRTRSIDILYSN